MTKGKTKTTERLGPQINSEIDAAEAKKATTVSAADTPALREAVEKVSQGPASIVVHEEPFTRARVLAVVDEYMKRCKDGDTLRLDAVVEMRKRIASL